MRILQYIDPEIAQFIESEENRQSSDINLIASENYVHPAILEANASALTNKYAEGYPNKRYYGGCEFVDKVESLAIERCKALFKAEHANVQPHSGSQANMAVMAAFLKPGDTILGMGLIAGGHLTHGHTVNFSGSLYKTVQYSVDPITELLDFKEIESLAKCYIPKLIIAGASAYSRIIDFERFSIIAKSVNAYFMADIAHIAGLVATGHHPSPVPYADIITGTTHKTLRGPRGGFILCKNEHKDIIDRAIMPGIQGGPCMHTIAAKAIGFKLAMHDEFKVYQGQVIANAQIMAKTFHELGYKIVSNGTDNHLFVIDLRSKGINGRIAELALEKVGITVSRSTIPNDPEKPWITSGIRIGTAAITTRGYTQEQAKKIAISIDEALKFHYDNAKLEGIKTELQTLTL